MIEHHIEEPLGDLTVSSLVPYQLQRWMDELTPVHGDGELWSAAACTSTSS